MTLSDEEFHSRLNAAQARLQEFNRATAASGQRAGAGGGLGSALAGAVGGGIVAGADLFTNALRRGGQELLDFGRRGFESVFQLGKMGQQLGTTTEFLQSLHSVAAEAGVSVEEMDTGLMRLNRSLGMA